MKVFSSRAVAVAYGGRHGQTGDCRRRRQRSRSPGATQELEARYGLHYRIMSRVSPREALAVLEQLRGEGAEVALVLADQWMPEMAGAEFMARVRELHPTTRRVVLLSWADQPWLKGAVPGAALGQIDLYTIRPASWPDEPFHSGITESLEEWWRAAPAGAGDRERVVGSGARDT